MRETVLDTLFSCDAISFLLPIVEVIYWLPRDLETCSNNQDDITLLCKRKMVKINEE